MKKEKLDLLFVKDGYKKLSDHTAEWKVRSFAVPSRLTLKKTRHIYTVTVKLDELRN